MMVNSATPTAGGEKHGKPMMGGDMKKIIRLSIVVCLLISIPFSQALCQDNDVIMKGNLRYLVLEGAPMSEVYSTARN